ncbi:MAG: phosphoribosylaminoimidazolesuccinocarboxamide synthase [Phycisphaerales bacterium]|jgi:phosphoribosylaminoimidazole-succinocarboxamide synthase
MNTTQTSVYETHLPFPERRQGKVRDIYQIPAQNGEAGKVLIIASDRISAFDVVLPTAVSGKGQELTTISCKWFDFIRDLGIIEDHLLSTKPEDVPGLEPSMYDQCEGRMMLGRACEVIPVEFVVRGYLAGSGWKEYQNDGTVCGIALPEGLQLSSKLHEPIFTPATKATEGHDENIDFDTACTIVGHEVMERLRSVSLEIYTKATAYASKRGIILADTKFEFGYAIDTDGNTTDEILLIDEVLTPDSSRFWPADEYGIGREQDSFDKQYVRNWLETIVASGEWDKTPPGPTLPQEIIDGTVARYREAASRLFN